MQHNSSKIGTPTTGLSGTSMMIGIMIMTIMTLTMIVTIGEEQRTKCSSWILRRLHANNT